MTRSRNEETNEQNSTQQHNTNNNNNNIVTTSLLKASDLINDNLILARYATVATVCGLTAYGLWSSPLFFRFYKIADIPPFYFRKRKILCGTLVQQKSLNKHGNAAYAYARDEVGMICVNFRHSALMERLLTRQLSSSNNGIINVQLAGIEAGPTGQITYTHVQDIVRNKRPVRLELLCRKASNESVVGRLYYKLSPLQLFSTDLAYNLIHDGQAIVSSGMYKIPEQYDDGRVCLDGTTDLDTLEKDAEYLNKLVSLEDRAVQDKAGLWSNESFRKERVRQMDEEKSGIFRILWNKLMIKRKRTP